MIRNQMESFSAPNQSGKSNCNPNLVRFSKNRKKRKLYKKKVHTRKKCIIMYIQDKAASGRKKSPVPPRSPESLFPLGIMRAERRIKYPLKPHVLLNNMLPRGFRYVEGREILGRVMKKFQPGIFGALLNKEISF